MVGMERSHHLLILFFSFMFICMLPFKPVYNFPLGLKIIATGEKQVDAKSSEVWLDRSTTALITDSKKNIFNEWDYKEKVLVSYQHQPATIFINDSLDSDAELIFIKTPYSGFAKVITGNYSRDYNLFANEAGVVKLKISDIPGSKINYISTLTKFFFYFVTLYIAFFMLFRLTRGGCKVPINAKKIVPAAVVIYSLPCLFIFFISTFLYWPAQMSPDSLTQWHQIVTKSYNDAHPVLSTLLYASLYHLYPHPQIIILSQAILFSVVIGIGFNELKNWGVNKYFLFAAAFLFSAFPPTFLLISTLWKDIPFTIGILLLTIFSLRIARLNWHIDYKSLAAICIAGILVFTMRHNGIAIVAPYFLLLLVCVKGRINKIKISSVLAFQLFLFVFSKTILLSLLGAAPIGQHYKAIYAVHVIGAMEKSNVKLDDEGQKLVNTILPQSSWQSQYNCKSVVPLFWDKNISYDFLSKNSTQINKLAFKMILANPFVFLKHQACVTSFVWRITPNQDDYLTISPNEIIELPVKNELQLTMASKMPHLKEKVIQMQDFLFMDWQTYFRPAGYFIFGLFFAVILSIVYGYAFFIVFTPAFLNAAGWLVLAGSQDYRYMWPSVIVSIYLMLFIFQRRKSSTY